MRTLSHRFPTIAKLKERTKEKKKVTVLRFAKKANINYACDYLVLTKLISFTSENS